MNAKEALGKVVKMLNKFQFDHSGDERVYEEECTTIESALTELESIKKRAEDVRQEMKERFDKANGIREKYESGSAFVTQEEQDESFTYFYNQAEKDEETEELIDFIIKGEKKQ